MRGWRVNGDADPCAHLQTASTTPHTKPSPGGIVSSSEPAMPFTTLALQGCIAALGACKVEILATSRRRTPVTNPQV